MLLQYANVSREGTQPINAFLNLYDQCVLIFETESAEKGIVMTIIRNSKKVDLCHLRERDFIREI